ncbi:MAG: hypothetical protein SFY66_13960 [Oculatellaceae cyanobacterium bins.114]|nr:hypothetical protein [Oculatellaceae cyanobacterium bins.114]
MNPLKVNENNDINFLITTQKAYSCVEAEQVQAESTNAASHVPRAQSGSVSVPRAQSASPERSRRGHL